METVVFIHQGGCLSHNFLRFFYYIVSRCLPYVSAKSISASPVFGDRHIKNADRKLTVRSFQKGCLEPSENAWFVRPVGGLSAYSWSPQFNITRNWIAAKEDIPTDMPKGQKQHEKTSCMLQEAQVEKSLRKLCRSFFRHLKLYNIFSTTGLKFLQYDSHIIYINDHAYVQRYHVW